MVGLAKMGLGDQCVCLLSLCGREFPHQYVSCPRAVVKQDNGYSGNKGGGGKGRMVLGKHYHPPHDHPRNLISSSLFRNGGCGGRPCQPKNVHSISNTSSDHPYVHTTPLSHSSNQKWEGNTLGNLDRREFLFISFFGVARLSLSPSSDLEIDDV